MRMPEPASAMRLRSRRRESWRSHSAAQSWPSAGAGPAPHRARRFRQSARPSIVNQVLRSLGRPLDTADRSFMEPRFAHDFRRVRVHTDSRRPSLRARSMRRLYCRNHIVFDSDYYSPDTAPGRHLLAHELTHAVQQQGGDHLIFRKEVYQSVARANRGSVAPGDWLDLDRRNGKWPASTDSNLPFRQQIRL